MYSEYIDRQRCRSINRVIGNGHGRALLFRTHHVWTMDITIVFVFKIEKRQLWVWPMGGWSSTLQTLRDTSDAFIGRACATSIFPSGATMVFVNEIYDVVVDTQFHKFYGRPFARYILLRSTRYLFLGNNQNKGIPGQFSPKNRYMLKSSEKHTTRPTWLAEWTSDLFLSDSGTGTTEYGYYGWVFNRFWLFFCVTIGL